MDHRSSYTHRTGQTGGGTGSTGSAGCDSGSGLFYGRVLDIDLTAGRCEARELPPSMARAFLGGRGVNGRMLYDLTGRSGCDGAAVDPLSPDNVVIFGTGPLTGTGVAGGARFNVTAKSPQTGIFGDSNAGGFFGPELRLAGHDHVVLRGKAPSAVYILISRSGVELRPARHLVGLDVPDTYAAVLAEIGDPRAQIACIGPAAEAGVRFCGVFVNVHRAAARTGIGTVLASKNVKAVVVSGRGGKVALADPGAFQKHCLDLRRLTASHEQYRSRNLMGTTRLVSMLNKMGCLATRHYSTGRFESVDAVSGEELARLYRVRSKSCFSCQIGCSRLVRVDGPGKPGVELEGPEFEGLAGFTSRIGNQDLAMALAACELCNRHGMDVITASECLAFATECVERGILTRSDIDGIDLVWGNAAAALSLLAKIARREGAGELFAGGALAAARIIGRGSEELVMHVKGLEIFQADPRGIKAYALGLAVSSRGGDHTRSEPSFEFSGDEAEAVRRYGTPDAAHPGTFRGKGLVVKDYEERSALSDALGFCKNIGVNMELLTFERAAELLAAATGLALDPSDVRAACERIVNQERLFNLREGLSPADDALPARFTREPLPEDCGPSAGQVVELEPMMAEYYGARGWDRTSGWPTRERLALLGLSAPEPRVAQHKQGGEG